MNLSELNLICFGFGLKNDIFDTVINIPVP